MAHDRIPDGARRPTLDLRWIGTDAALIILARGMRGFAQGTVSVLVAIYLHLVGFNPFQIGLFLSAGLAGAAAYTMLIVFVGNRFGRRRLLAAFSAMLAVASLAVIATNSFPVMAVVTLVGGFSVAQGTAAGGPFAPLEQASLAGLVPSARRTDLYAVYGIVSMVGTSLGALAVGMPAIYQNAFGLTELSAIRVAFVTFAIFHAVATLCYLLPSSAVEVGESERRWVNPLRLPSRRLIFTLSGLFSVDRFGGGLIVQSLVSLWFFTRFGIELEQIGFIFFGSNLLSAVSLWVAAKLANRIGLINTMVFTHIPANLLLLGIPFLPVAWLAAAFWLIRGFLGNMDVPTRESYTMAIVGPNERSAMAGITSVSRTTVGAASPSVAMALWSIGAASIPFVSCGVIKVAYDVALYFMFRNVRTPEEVDKGGSTSTRV